MVKETRARRGTRDSFDHSLAWQLESEFRGLSLTLRTNPHLSPRMISFSSFPVTQVYDNDYPEIRREVDEDAMDYEYDDDFSGGKLTCPGEVVTSSQAFMR